jgi:hypothetical protein
MIKKIFLLLSIAVLLNSCGVMEQASQMTMLSKCDFRLDKIENIRLAGIDIQNIKSYEDLGVIQILNLTTAVARKDLPLSFTLGVEARNPNNKTAAMNRMDWILYIDDIEMTRGIVNDRVEINPNGGIANIPLSLNFNLMEVLQGKSGDALLNFGFNLAGSGDRPTRILVKVKPTIYIGSTAIDYPGYINVKTEFTSGSSNTISL